MFESVYSDVWCKY